METDLLLIVTVIVPLIGELIAPAVADAEHGVLLKRTTDAGDTATLQCPSSASVQHVDWNFYLNNASTNSTTNFSKLTTDGAVRHGYKHRLNVERESDGDWRLVIRNVQHGDVGIYECRTRHDRKLAEFHLQVPYFRVEVCEGQNATLECRTTLDHRVVWRYSKTFMEERSLVYSQGRILTRDITRFSVLSKHRNYDLVIHNTSLSDSGIFACTEDGGFGPGEVSWALTVLEEISNPECTDFTENHMQRKQHVHNHTSSDQMLVNGSRRPCSCSFLVVALLLLFNTSCT